MAIVSELTERLLDRETTHTRCECTYCVVTGADGVRYLQIDTYGSSTRKIPNKKSQSIRFAPQAIRQLKTLIEQNFSN